MLHCYSVFNFILQSEIPLPPLRQLPVREYENAVFLLKGEVSAKGIESPLHAGLYFKASHSEYWLSIPSAGRFLISQGKYITISPNVTTDEETIVAFIFGVCFEVLLRQRNLLVLSGQALQIEGRGVVILGSLSLGQEMLLGMFYQQDYVIASTHFFALDAGGNILPGIPQLHLSSNVLAYLKLDQKEFKSLRSGLDKYVLPLDNQYCTTLLPLDVVYLLKPNQQSNLHIMKLPHKEKVTHLQMNHSNMLLSRTCYPSDTIQDPYHEILQKVDMYCINLPPKKLNFQQVIEAIKEKTPSLRCANV